MKWIIFLLKLVTRPLSNMIFYGYKNKRTADCREGEKLLYKIGGQRINIFSTYAKFRLDGMYFDAEKVKLINDKPEAGIPHPKKVLKDKQTVIIFNGSSGHYERSYNKVRLFVDRGFDVYIFNYPGYGESSGKPSPKTLCEAANLIYTHLAQNLDMDKVLVYSISLGSGPATYLANKYKGKYLLDRPFATLSSATRNHINRNIVKGFLGMFIGYVVSFVVKFLYEFPNKTNIYLCESKIAILYAKDDEMIPYQDVLDLQRHYGYHCAFEMPGGHGLTKDVWYYIDHSKFEESLEYLGFEMIDVNYTILREK